MPWHSRLDNAGRLWNFPSLPEWANREVIVTVEPVSHVRLPDSPGRALFLVSGEGRTAEGWDMVDGEMRERYERRAEAVLEWERRRMKKDFVYRADEAARGTGYVVLNKPRELHEGLAGKRVRVTIEELREEKSLGQIAFLYGHGGTWELQPEGVQKNWEAVARAVVEEYERRRF